MKCPVGNTVFHSPELNNKIIIIGLMAVYREHILCDILDALLIFWLSQRIVMAGLLVLEFSPFFALVIWLVLFIQLCQLKGYTTVYFAWWYCSNCRNLLMNTWVWMKMSCTTLDISDELFMIHFLFLLKYKCIPAYIKIVGTIALSLSM